MVAHKSLPRITYFNVHDDFSAVYEALEEERASLEARLGRFHPNIIGGKQDVRGERYQCVSPIDRRIKLGEFVEASSDAVADAIAAARKAFTTWGQRPWEARVMILRRFADMVESRKYELAAANVLEVGKIMGEGLGEVEEAVDMVRYFCNEIERQNGFNRPLGRAYLNEHTSIRLRPYGVFASIAPFNFPVALSIKMIVPVILCGNCAVFKPSERSGLTGTLLMETFKAADVPDGVVNLLCGFEAGRLLSDGAIDGIAFTGSHDVGMSLFRKFAAGGEYARPVIAEMGGKNPVYVSPSADLDVAAEGLARSSFGLQGQKCSCSEVAYVHDAIYEKFLDRLVGFTASMKVGDPRERSVMIGPLNNQELFDRWQSIIEHSSKFGRILHGGRVLSGTVMDEGFYVEPTIVCDLPDDDRLFMDETFLPILAIRRYHDLKDAIEKGNSVKYGLTSAFYGYGEELDYYLSSAESGLLFTNRRTGATTGAWPGYQSFPGWKGSGLTGKGGFGPNDLQQYMREQSLTLMRESE